MIKGPNEEKITKTAKNWFFKEPNKTRLRARLSKIAPRALIGQKVNKGNSCCTSVSSKQKSKHRHADNTCRNILTTRITTEFTTDYDTLQITEVSQVKKFSDTPNKLKLKHHHLRLPGKTSTSELNFTNDRPIWPLPDKKVRKVTNVPYLYSRKSIEQKRNLTHRVFTGTTMGKTNKKPKDDDTDDEKPRERGHKDLKKWAKKSKPQKGESQPNKEGIKPFDLKKSIAGALKTIDKRKSTGSLEDREVQKHLEAITATVSKSTGPTRRSPRKLKRPQITAPEKSAPKVTDIATPKTPEKDDTPGTSKNKAGNAKRKRGNKKKGTDSESDSSESETRRPKKSKRSRISETSEELTTSSSEDKEVPPPTPPNESPKTRHRRTQLDIRAQKTGSDETRNRLKNRSNVFYETVTLKSGRKITRRCPTKKFKAQRKKPETEQVLKTMPQEKC